jgi:hypothetical protein
MKAKIKTKSNYRGLNGKWLAIKEIVGTRVTCYVDTPDLGKITADFALKEVEEMHITEGNTSLHPLFQNICSKAMINNF